MQVTEDDDPESRGRLAPHELPHVMACVLAAQRRVQRCVAALAATRAAGDDDAVERRLIQKTARARRQKRCLCMALACHFMSYDSVQMAPLQHAAAEMTEPWNELPEAEFVRVTRWGTRRFCEACDKLVLFPDVLHAENGSTMTRRLAMFTLLRRWVVPDRIIDQAKFQRTSTSRLKHCINAAIKQLM